MHTFNGFFIGREGVVQQAGGGAGANEQCQVELFINLWYIPCNHRASVIRNNRGGRFFAFMFLSNACFMFLSKVVVHKSGLSFAFLFPSL